MDNQLVQSYSWAQRILLIALVLTLTVGIGMLGIYWQRISDPYVREVLSLEGNVTRGHAIYEINCAGCHGTQADGSVGPSLHNVPKRKSKIGLIHQVVSGNTPPMPKFQPTPQEMADLLSYLEEL